MNNNKSKATSAPTPTFALFRSSIQNFTNHHILLEGSHF
uniref:Uncharacterized protein n=1 Tax=Manihot esculenta TaxID=3983 RepID=A0A2C9U8V4_MANES